MSSDSYRTSSDPAELDTCHRSIIDHMGRRFGPVDDMSLTEVVPASGVRIHAIRARSADDSLILFTTGMSDSKQNVPAGEDEYRFTELFIRLPAGWPLDQLAKPEFCWPIDWLRRIAVYPHENETWLGGAFAILSNNEPPEPLGGGTELNCLLLLCETEELNPVRCPDGRLVMLYSLVPLYAEERDLEKAHGPSALFDRLEAHGVVLEVDPRRINVGIVE